MHKNEEAARCLLCNDAPCTKACGKGDVARAIRAIRFDNAKNAWRFILEMSMDPVINGTHGRAIELSGIGGIETWRDAVDFIQLGCRKCPTGAIGLTKRIPKKR